ncbi:hypothetical protein IY145_10650 [Methylosinus sp. H3A]|uniref:hypothetical protein n=1 Tax=Methylosinus sp. H3A TaxID=2785786 RepID=UPI0018C27029|nr:hypothetical protein [Methylosinus sp. H3A]MBG0809838.1 hypothetical protein [Methylosinus sp. H3A]
MSMTVEMILRLIDQATGPIRGVESELERLQKTAAAIDKQRTTGGGVKASVWFEQQEAIRKAREEAERYEQTMRKINAAQSAAMTAAAARGLERASTATFRAGLREGVAGEHSEVSLEAQGNSLAQIEDIQRKSAELSRRFRAFSQTQVETMLGDAQTFVGSLDHATGLMPDLLRLRSIQQGMHGHSDDKEFSYLVKALEQGGVASDPEKARLRLDTFARWMEVYRDTFHVNDINEFYRGLKGPIARSLDEDFLRGAGGHFIQEMGGHAVGNALTQMAMQIEAGRAQPRALAALKEIGLLDMNKAIEGGPFGVKAAEPGAIKGGSLFMHRPDLWVWNILGPALDKLSAEKREEVESALFSDQTARNIADKLLHQRGVIEKDFGFNKRAPGLSAAELWQRKDPALAATGVRSQFDNLLRDAAKPFMPAAAGVMNWFSELESRLGAIAEKHPAATAAGGIGAIFAGWTAAAALARRGLIKAGEAWGEGVARAAGEGGAAAVAGGGLLKGLVRGGLAGLLLGALWDQRDRLGAAIAGKTVEHYRDEVDAIHSAFHRQPGEAAASVFERMRRMPTGTALPFFAQPTPAPAALQPIGPPTPIPTFAALQGVPGAPQQPASTAAPAPHVDMSQIEDAVRKAEEAGQQIKQSLEVKAEAHVDSSSVDALLAKLREAVGLIGQINRGGSARGHGLNDGAEAH